MASITDSLSTNTSDPEQLLLPEELTTLCGSLPFVNLIVPCPILRNKTSILVQFNAVGQGIYQMIVDMKGLGIKTLSV